MSHRGYHRYMSLAGEDYRGKTSSEIADELREILNAGIHGLCFSPYDNNQKPGDQMIGKPISRRNCKTVRQRKIRRMYSKNRGSRGADGAVDGYLSGQTHR